MDIPSANVFDHLKKGALPQSSVDDAIDRETMRLLVERDQSSIWIGSVGVIFIAFTYLYFGSLLSILPNLIYMQSQLIFSNYVGGKVIENLNSAEKLSKYQKIFNFNFIWAGSAWGGLMWVVRDSFLVEPTSMFIFIISVIALGIASVSTALYKPAFKRYVFGFSVAAVSALLAPLAIVGYYLLFALPVLIIIMVVLGNRVAGQAREAIRMQIENHSLSAELAFANSELEKSLRVAEELSRKDSLTGLLNRRAFEERAAKFCSQLKLEEACHILLMDLDKFKRINDNYGHVTGDAVLVETARLIPRVLGHDAQVARWGGEEFIAVVRGKSPEGAHALAEDLRKAILNLANDEWPKGIKVSMSMGIAALGDGKTLASVIARADDALYAAKDAGRNCVHSA